VRLGVLALQGAFREHIMALEALDVAAVPIRLPDQLTGLAGLVIPGGESTAISKLMETYGFYAPLLRAYEEGMAVWGTCAGAILVASEILDALPGQRPLGIMDVSVRRNAYGRQVDSFEANLHFSHLGPEPFRGVFIRAPWIERTGGEVEILAEHDGHVIAAREGLVLATTFHPELTGDLRVHRYFVEEIASHAHEGT
jgi:5'-phosphate synthase pdxT subunit